jgi:hypothetical protein
MEISIEQPSFAHTVSSLRRAGMNNLWKEFCQLQLRTVASDKSLDKTIGDQVMRILKEFIQKL